MCLHVAAASMSDDSAAGELSQGHDRREMIRFEPDKEDRRSGKDRRKAPSWNSNTSRS